MSYSSKKKPSSSSKSQYKGSAKLGSQGRPRAMGMGKCSKGGKK
jgi:hypothetical protein